SGNRIDFVRPRAGTELRRLGPSTGVTAMIDAHAGDRIRISPNSNRVRVHFAGLVVADTRRALNLDETGHHVVAYIPRGDVDMSLLTRTQHRTHCPYKGEPAYY